MRGWREGCERSGGSFEEVSFLLVFFFFPFFLWFFRLMSIYRLPGFFWKKRKKKSNENENSAIQSITFDFFFHSF